jgi:uncharacterized RDD family membrane protein YckC
MNAITPDPIPMQGPPVAVDVPDVLGRRVAAALIDIAAMFVLFVGLAATMGDRTVGNGQFYVGLHGTAAFGYLGLVLLYFFSLEMATGRTIGKKILGLKVVSVDGTRPGVGRIAIRTLFRLVDWLPFFNLVGFILVVSLKSRQRLGDLVAKTVVVRA